MSLSLGPRHYFAVVDDQHDIKDPLTIVRVFDAVGPDGVRELSRDLLWTRTTLLERIDSGDVPYRALPISEEQALRIRQRWEQKIDYRYSVVVEDDNPNDEPVGVSREWNASTGGAVYEERYVGHRVRQWLPSNRRWESLDGRGDTSIRIVPCDAATVHHFISRVKGR